MSKECILLSADPRVALRDLATAIIVACLSQSVSIFLCRRDDCSDFDVNRLPKGSIVSAPSLWFLNLEDPTGSELVEFEKRVVKVGCAMRTLDYDSRLMTYLGSMACSKSLRESYGNQWQYSTEAVRLTTIGALLAAKANVPQLRIFLQDLAFLQDVSHWSDRLVELYVQSTKERTEEEWTCFVNRASREQLLIAS